MTTINIDGTKVKCWCMAYNPCGLSEFRVEFDGISYDTMAGCFDNEESVARRIYYRNKK